MTAHMSAPLRESVLKSAAEIVIPDEHDLNELDVILAAIKTAAADRNDMVHGSWCYRESDKAVLLVQQKARSNVAVTSRPVTVDEIKLKALALYNAGIDLMEFLITQDRVPALPRDRVRGANTHRERKARRKNAGK